MDTKNDAIDKLKSLPHYQELTNEYSESSLDGLIKAYSDEWKLYRKYGNYYNKLLQHSNNTEKQYAIQAFTDIQTKKLFNLECLWKAGNIELNIVCSHAFDYHAKLIHECDLIQPISEEEINAYKEFLFDEPEFPDSTYHYTKHEEIVQAGREKNQFYPKWFAFYDKKFDTNNLLYLDDIKTEYEIKCIRKELVKDDAASEKASNFFNEFEAIMNAFNTGDFSEVLVVRDQQFLEFAEILEDYVFARHLKNRIQNIDSEPDSSVQKAYDYLDGIFFKIIPVKQYFSQWQDGICYTAWDYMKQQVIKSIDEHFKDYRKGWKPVEYSEEEREKELTDYQFWENAYILGKKKLEDEGNISLT